MDWFIISISSCIIIIIIISACIYYKMFTALNPFLMLHCLTTEVPICDMYLSFNSYCLLHL